MNKKYLLSTSVILILAIISALPLRADYTMFSNRLSTSVDGKQITENYYRNYNFDIEDRFIEYTHKSIELYLAGSLRRTTKRMYAIVLNKIYTDISYYSDMPQSTEAMEILKECVSVNADYMTMELKCVPSMLWDEGYYKFAECAGAEIKQTIDYCLTGSP